MMKFLILVLLSAALIACHSSKGSKEDQSQDVWQQSVVLQDFRDLVNSSPSTLVIDGESCFKFGLWLGQMDLEAMRLTWVDPSDKFIPWDLRSSVYGIIRKATSNTFPCVADESGLYKVWREAVLLRIRTDIQNFSELEQRKVVFEKNEKDLYFTKDQFVWTIIKMPRSSEGFKNEQELRQQVCMIVGLASAYSEGQPKEKLDALEAAKERCFRF